jgi:D-3-phosphoglycerate dehydrogenase
MKIVVTEPLRISTEVKQRLAALGEVAYGPFDDRSLRRELADCDVLMVRLGRRIDGDLLAEAPRLRFILTATTGLDHIDLDAARANVRVISLRDCPAAIMDVSATAEHSWGLLLALVRRIPAAAADVLSGGWDRDRFWGTELKGKQLGIVGYGRIGKMVAGYAAAFGMDVVACDRHPAKVCSPAAPVTFAELLEESDIVSVHVTASPENRHLFDEAALTRFKPGAFLINTARGSLVDEQALAKLVGSGRLAGVAVDVLDGEGQKSLESSPLLACARAGYNVVITPHIGGATTAAIARSEGAVVAELERLL